MLPAKAVSLWHAVLEKVEQKTTPQQFATWFRNLEVAELGDRRVVLRVPSKFHRDWIVTYYREVVEEAVAAVLGGARELHLEIGGKSPDALSARQAALAAAPTKPGGTANGGATAPPSAAEAGRSERRPPLRSDGTRPNGAVTATARVGAGAAAVGVRTCGDLPLTEGFDFARFVIGPSNQLAAAAARSLATATTAALDFHTLFVVGATGTGKTHLLQAAARAAAEPADGRQVAYVRGENFLNEFVTACAQGAEATHRFRERWRSLDVVCFDDLQLLAGKSGTQQELVHTLNAWSDRGARLLFAASCAPGEQLALDPALQARLAGAYRLTLRAPDRETRRELLAAKSRQRGEGLAGDVLDFLADLPTGNVRELEGALTSVIAGAKLTGTAISLRTARAALEEDALMQRPASSPDRILKAVCNHFEVTMADICSPRRPQALSFARQAAMYLLRERTELSLSEIGALLGGRDHTTILHGIRKIEEADGSDGRVRDHLTRLRSLLER
ncbi:MAG: chromosomal replication initiator protein DnaA [Planctomycetes bacterium]|nr:chromosomal replication initiator protein DnaA [Planctomycetota bacterium]